MLNQIKQRLHSRENAGRLLAEKLLVYKHANAVLLAIPRGGVPVGQQIAGVLNIPSDVIFSRRIKHPAHGDLSIGAVSLDEVILQDGTEFIPQSYIQQQVSHLQRTLREEFRRYYQNTSQKNIRDKTVIIVDDVIREIEEVSACLHTVRKQEPEKIVVAAAVANVRAVNFLIEEEIEFHYLLTEFQTQTKAYSYFPELTEDETTEMFKNTRQLSRH